MGSILKGVSSYYSVFKWISILSLLWTLALVALFVMFKDDTLLLSNVLATATLFFIGIGLWHTIPSIMCIKGHKKWRSEIAVVYLHNKMDTNHILRLDTPHNCSDCKERFYGYNPAYCSKCGSANIQSASEYCKEKYVFMFRFMQIMTGSALVVLGLLIIWCFLSIPEEPLLGFILAVVFGGTYTFAGFIEYVTQNYGEGKKDTIVPMCARLTRCRGKMIFTEIFVKETECPNCGSVHGAFCNEFCTQCGKQNECHEES